MLREVVAKGLDAHAIDDRLAQRILAIVGAQDLKQINGIILAEAGIKLTLGSNAYPIAGVAEIWLCGEMKPIRDSEPGMRQ